MEAEAAPAQSFREKAQNHTPVPTMSEIEIGVAQLLDAANFAAIAHGDQKRKATGLPYIVHPLGVANILANEGEVNHVLVLQAALLHDVVEDTKTTLAEIHASFGPIVANMVAEVTDDKSLPKSQRKRAQVDHAVTMSYGARLVKLADKLYNLRDLRRNPPPDWPLSRIRGYFVWCRAVVDGMRGTNAKLEQKLAEIFASEIEFGGATVPVIPSEPSEEEQLVAYYAEMDQCK